MGSTGDTKKKERKFGQKELVFATWEKAGWIHILREESEVSLHITSDLGIITIRENKYFT